MNNIITPEIVETENGKLDVKYYCARVQKEVMLCECERLCPRYSSCDNVATMNDKLVEEGY